MVEASTYDAGLTALSEHDVFRTCSRSSLARMLAQCEPHGLEPGARLYERGEAADSLWFLCRGALRSDDGQHPPVTVTEGFVGEEAVLGLLRYSTTTRASEVSTLLRIPAHAVPTGVRRFQDPRAQTIVEHLLRVEPESAEDSPPASRWPPWSPRLAAWVLVVLVAASIFYLGADSELFSADNGQRWRQLRTATVLGGGCLMWILGVTRPYVACLLMLFCLLALGVAPSMQTLSGFASTTFFMALSLLALGVMIVRSGLITRVALWLEELLPSSAIARHLAAMLCVCGSTAVMSDDRTRVSAWLDVQPSLFPTERGEHRRSLVIRSMMVFYAVSFAPIYLTGSTANLTLFGVMPKQHQARLGWLQWFEYAGVAFVVLLAGLVALILWNRKALKEPAEPRPDRARGRQVRRRIIGRLRPQEVIVICAVLGWGIAQLTTDFHKIEHRLTALMMLAVFLVGAIPTRSRTTVSIDWRSLLLLGAVIGLTRTIFEVELASAFEPMLPEEPVVLIAAIVVLGLVLGAVVPHGSVLAGMLTLPLATARAFDPWVLIVIVLMTAPCPVATPSPDGSEPQWSLGRRWRIALVVLRLVALAASIPYWSARGMIG